MSKKYTVILNDFELHTLFLALSGQLRTEETVLREYGSSASADVERRRKCLGRLIYLFDRCGRPV